MGISLHDIAFHDEDIKKYLCQQLFRLQERSGITAGPGAKISALQGPDLSPF